MKKHGKTGKQSPLRTLMRQLKWIVPLLVVIGLIAQAFVPKPVQIDVGHVSRGAMMLTVDEDGQTQVRDRYVIFAPLSGHVLRLEWEVGDTVKAGDVLATIDPGSPTLLDPRARAQAEAMVNAAEATVRSADRQWQARKIEAAQLEKSFLRNKILFEKGNIADATFEQIETAYLAAKHAAEAAESAVDIARFEWEQTKAALMRFDPSSDTGEKEDREFVIKSPIDGKVLRFPEKSARMVQTGEVLLEVGDPGRLEMRIDVLSQDAVKIEAGQKIVIDHWGGSRSLVGKVRLVEPAGYTKVSALGVDEQRVDVIADFEDPQQMAQLGDGYRIEARIVIWESADVLQVPAGALFRQGESWAVYRIIDGKAAITTVNLRRNNGEFAEVVSGLGDGDPVILHPGDRIEDATLVTPAEMNTPLPTIEIFVAWMAMLSFSCSPVGPSYLGPPETEQSKSFFGSRKAEQSAPEIDHWWRLLKSRELNGLIHTALQDNLDLAIATQRLREARALRKQAASAFLPHAGVNLSFTRLELGGLLDGLGAEGGNIIANPLDYWSSGADVSWEIDVFGGKRRAVRGAKAREQAAQEALHGVRLAIVAEVAEAYFTTAGLREQRTKVETQVELQDKQLQDITARVEAGASSRLDLDRTKAGLEVTRSQLPTLDAGITVQLRRLALLLGRPSSALDDRAVASLNLPENLPMVKMGFPAELVLRRPDLRQAERELAAATEDIGVAASNFYPRFLISGAPSGFGGSVTDLFNASNYIWQAGPRVEWNLFAGGANRAALEAANARQKANMLGYEKQVLAAVGEVESELANLRAETKRLAIIQRATRARAEAARRISENHEAGAVDYIEVLLEEKSLRELEITEIRIKSQMLLLWIRLQKALGGGWK